METKHPVERPSESKFPAICNQCGVMTPRSRKICKILHQFLCFFEKQPLMTKNFQYSVPKVYMATPIDVVVFKCHKICLMGNQWNCALFTEQKTNKISDASQTVTTVRIAPKISQGQPPTFDSHCSRFHPNRFTFGGVITKCVKAVRLPHRVFSW